MKCTLVKADREEIKALIAATPGIDGRTVRLWLLASGAVRVRTGRGGVETGSGNKLIVERRGGRWCVVEESIVCWMG